MNTKRFFNTAIAFMFCLALASTVQAQRNYRHNDGFSNRGYSNRAYSNSYSYNRPIIHAQPLLSYAMRYPVTHMVNPYLHYGPQFGVRYNVLPFGFMSFYLGSSLYYYNQGIYYQPYYNGGYSVVAPPLGASVNNLPGNAKVTYVNGQRYLEVGGTFYQEQVGVDNRMRYVVVGTNGVLNTQPEVVPQQQIPQQYQQPMQPQVQPQYQPQVQPQVQVQPQIQVPQQQPATIQSNSIVGSRLLQLPNNCKTITVDNQKMYQSPSGTIYKEITIDGAVQYEVAGSSLNQ